MDQKKKLSVNYPENFPIIYSNFSSFRISAFDFTIDIGIRSDDEKGASVQINSRIIMSIQHAKVFVSKMKDLIENYERDFGTIATQPRKKDEKK